MAYNEGANIAHAIQTILRQQPSVGRVRELIVVASGCTDQTVPIVAAIARKDARVRLLVQERREGKASAINLFLGAAQCPILVMASGDVLLEDDALEALLRHFRDPAVGMVGGHPIPMNEENTLLGHAVHLQWRLHDHVAREAPKLGEVVAFRNVVRHIPVDTPVDEISIQALVTQMGYRLVYEPQAIVYNRGPSTISDFLRQRRRISAGHLRIRQQQGYAAPTMSVRRAGRSLLATRPFGTPRETWWTVCAIGLEAVARGLGRYDYMRNRPHHIWQIATTTKPLLGSADVTTRRESVLVFRILNFHALELELGERAGNLLTQQVMWQMAQELGSDTAVSANPSGTITAVLPVEREEAEQTAQRLIDTIGSAPVRFKGHRDGVLIKLACGIITFSADLTNAQSIPAAV